jgi:hypothetical protein
MFLVTFILLPLLAVCSNVRRFILIHTNNFSKCLGELYCLFIIHTSRFQKLLFYDQLICNEFISLNICFQLPWNVWNEPSEEKDANRDKIL